MLSTRFQDHFARRFLLAMLIVFVAFTLLYLAYPDLPGNRPERPCGWWGWADQSEYLRWAQAFHDENLNGKAHFYPPLWSLLGSIFIGWLPMHAFFIPALAPRLNDPHACAATRRSATP